MADTPILDDPQRRDALLNLEGLSADKVALLWQAHELRQLARELWAELGERTSECTRWRTLVEHGGVLPWVMDFQAKTAVAVFEIEQALGKALGYPKLYPDVADVDDGTVCTGEHVPETLAAEAAGRIRLQQEELTALRRTVELTENNLLLHTERFEEEWLRAEGLQRALNEMAAMSAKLGCLLARSGVGWKTERADLEARNQWLRERWEAEEHYLQNLQAERNILLGRVRALQAELDSYPAIGAQLLARAEAAERTVYALRRAVRAYFVQHATPFPVYCPTGDWTCETSNQLAQGMSAAARIPSSQED